MIPVLMKDPKIVAALRLLETSVIVTFLGVLTVLQSALSSPAGLSGFDWHNALNALVLGLVSGVVNAAMAYLNAVKKGSEGQ